MDVVTEAEQVAAFNPLATSVHVPETSPVSEELSASVPWGLLCVPVAVSVTVTEAVLAWPTTTEVGFSVAAVVVVRRLMVSFWVAAVRAPAWSAAWIVTVPVEVPLK